MANQYLNVKTDNINVNVPTKETLEKCLDSTEERIKYYGDPDIVPSDSGYFTVNATGETITGLTDAGKTQTGTLVIPYKINGVEITTLSGNADNSTSILNGSSNITKVILPNTIINISDYAFRKCSSLTTINIPNSVTNIGDYAFFGCKSLTTTINIPNSVTSIRDSAFNGCKSLTTINIPNSVTSIGDLAFSNTVSLKSIEIPNSVTSIDTFAFFIYDTITDTLIPNPNLIIYCEQGSYAETYAKEIGFNIVYTDVSAITLVGQKTANDGEIFNDYDNNVASGNYSHAEGFQTTASGERSHAEGTGTTASGAHSHVQGKYNIEDTENKYAHIVGNGTSKTTRSNAHTLDWNGNAWFAGNITVGTNSDNVLIGSQESTVSNITNYQEVNNKLSINDFASGNSLIDLTIGGRTHCIANEDGTNTLLFANSFNVEELTDSQNYSLEITDKCLASIPVEDSPVYQDSIKLTNDKAYYTEEVKKIYITQSNSVSWSSNSTATKGLAFVNLTVTKELTDEEKNMIANNIEIFENHNGLCNYFTCVDKSQDQLLPGEAAYLCQADSSGYYFRFWFAIDMTNNVFGITNEDSNTTKVSKILSTFENNNMILLYPKATSLVKTEETTIENINTLFQPLHSNKVIVQVFGKNGEQSITDFLIHATYHYNVVDRLNYIDKKSGYAIKGFHPQSQTFNERLDTDTYVSGKIVLDSVEGIEVGMHYNIYYPIFDATTGIRDPKKWRGEIIGVNRDTNEIEYSCKKSNEFKYEEQGYTLPITSNSMYGNIIIHGGIIGSFDIEFSKEDNVVFNAQGLNTKAGINAHAEGVGTQALNFATHAEGYYTTATGERGHAEGYKTIASGHESHAEGNNTVASGYASHVEGTTTQATGTHSHAEGNNTVASGYASHVEGTTTQATGAHSHAEGYNTIASNSCSHAEGSGTHASGERSHAEGYYTKAIYEASHAEGIRTIAEGRASHAEGGANTASGTYSHAEGYGGQATGSCAHIEGGKSIAQGDYSHTEGYNTNTTASASSSHAEGSFTKATAQFSHAEGRYTIASGTAQHVQGKNNIEDTENKYAHIVGNGINSAKRSNAHTLDWNGNAWYAGNIKVGGTSYDDASAKELATKAYVDDAINASSGEATNASLERLNYYGDKNIIPSDATYSTNETGETIIGIDNHGSEVVIPYEINGVKITSLMGDEESYESAFANEVTKVILPNTITTIGLYAFAHCGSLISIDIPDSVTSIVGGAFAECTSLKSVEISNSVTSLDGSVFLNCTSLTSIEIPNSVTTLGSGVFYDCTSLTSINIPNSVTSISPSAFYGCTNLTIYCEQGSYAETYAKENNISVAYTVVKDITSSKVTTITVPTTGWTTSTDTNGTTYYSINITDSILTSTGYPITDVVLPSDIAAARLQSEAYQKVNKITVNDGSVDLYCFDSLPTVSFQIRIQLLYI